MNKTFLGVFVSFFILSSCIIINRNYQNLYNETFFLNKITDDLSFFPINGSRFRLSELKNVKAVVIAMRDKNCLASKKYSSYLSHLEKEYSKKGVKFIYNYVGQAKSEKRAEEDLKEFNFGGSYVIDKRQKVIHALQAKTAREIFILTPDRKMIYRGPVDDKVKKRFVSYMLSNVISGKKIMPKKFSAEGCKISRPVIKDEVFFGDVAPIIRDKCANCHNSSGIGPMNFTSYEDIVGRSAMFKYVIEKDLMPPWYLDPNTGPYKYDLSLTLKEKALLLKWARDDFPVKKKEDDLLKVKRRQENSKVSSDYIIPLPEKVVVPAGGSTMYKRFIIQTNFEEDRWIKNIRYIMHPKVVHHYIIRIIQSSFNKNNASHFNERIINYLPIIKWEKNIGYNNIQEIHKNTGIKLPRRSKLLLEVHYEPIAQEVIDNYTQVQMSFYEKKP
ncbi:MAG: redoxin domain-containing protein, partial [Oligoflexia bacterium]|nr:redoxin domain-containing protein [Oligoflexia bacterium]